MLKTGCDRGELLHVLLGVKQNERQVQHDGEPVPVDNEEESQESVDSGFGDYVGVETVAKVDGVDVITAKGEMSVYIQASSKNQWKPQKIKE